MAKWVKKKFNVKLFIILLLCAFLPGVIYGIYCAIPTRVYDQEPKHKGWLLALIGCLVNLVVWVYWFAYIMIDEGEFAFIFLLPLGLGLIALLAILCNKNAKSGALLLLAFFFILFSAAFNAAYFIYGFIALVGTIAAFIGQRMMNRYHKYHYLLNKDEEVVVE